MQSGASVVGELMASGVHVLPQTRQPGASVSRKLVRVHKILHLRHPQLELGHRLVDPHAHELCREQPADVRDRSLPSKLPEHLRDTRVNLLCRMG